VDLGLLCEIGLLGWLDGAVLVCIEGNVGGTELVFLAVLVCCLELYESFGLAKLPHPTNPTNLFRIANLNPLLIQFNHSALCLKT